MTEKKAILLVGSPRGIEKSTSGRLGGELLNALEKREFATERLHVHEAVRSTQGLEAALGVVAAADLVVLSFPLYVDSFPAAVIAFLEHVARRGAGRGRVQFALIIQCGFPEKEQNETAIAIARRFASEVGWTWLGAIALGGLETYGGSVNDALDRAAEALAKGESVPYVPLRKTMPAWVYRLGGNFMWWRVAKKNGVAGRLRAKPYAD
jgi:multimeric flavodoxin WrbA